MPRPSADGPGGPQEARARTTPAQDESAEHAAAHEAAYRDAVEQWRRLEARQEERRHCSTASR